MKKFLSKSALFFLPLLLVAIILEVLLRHIPNDYLYKREYLDKYSNNIEILFLGSSHTFNGINPDFITGNAFNASHISQTIDYDYEILKKYENNWKLLKYIVLPIDYYTLFQRLSNGIEYWRVKNYVIYYDMNKEHRFTDNYEIFTLNSVNRLISIYSYYFKNQSRISCSKLGYKNSDRIRNANYLEITGVTAAKRHNISDEKSFEQNIIVLENLIEFAEKYEIKILFYTSPAYHAYVSNLNKNQLEITKKTINDIVEGNSHCFYYNFLEDSSFYVSDFHDADHLNSFGAKKLSLKLNEILDNLKKKTNP